MSNIIISPLGIFILDSSYASQLLSPFDKTNMTGLCGILVLILWLIAFVVLGYKVFSKRGRYQ